MGTLQQTLDSYVEYGRTERPAKIAELMEVEALHASITSRLQALGGRTYAPAPPHRPGGVHTG